MFVFGFVQRLGCSRRSRPIVEALDVLTPVNREGEGGGGDDNYFHSDFAGITFHAAVASESAALSQSEVPAGTAVVAHRTIVVLQDGAEGWLIHLLSG